MGSKMEKENLKKRSLDLDRETLSKLKNAMLNHICDNIDPEVLKVLDDIEMVLISIAGEFRANYLAEVSLK